DAPVLRPIWPQCVRADAVLEPALQCTAAARSVVVLARPLVVEAREVIQHPHADDFALAGLRARSCLAPQEIVDDAGEAEPRTRAFFTRGQHQSRLQVRGYQLRHCGVVREAPW